MLLSLAVWAAVIPDDSHSILHDGGIFSQMTSSGLTLRVWENSVTYGGPCSVALVPNLSLSLPSQRNYSAVITGTIKLERDIDYTFNCSFTNVTMAFLWVGDHLICQQGAYRPDPCRVDNPIHALTTDELPVRMLIMVRSSSTDQPPSGSCPSSDGTDGGLAAADVRVMRLRHSNARSTYSAFVGYSADRLVARTIRDITASNSDDCMRLCDNNVAYKNCIGFVMGNSSSNCTLIVRSDPTEPCRNIPSVQQANATTYIRDSSCSSFHTLDSSSFSPTVSAAEKTREELQSSLTKGWGTYIHSNLLSLANLPSASTLTFAFCEISSGQCVTATKGEPDEPTTVRLGIHSINNNYGQYYVGWKGLNVSIEFTGGDNIRAMITPVSPPEVNRNFSLAVIARFAWLKPGRVAASNNTIVFRPDGNIPSCTVTATSFADGDLPTPSTPEAATAFALDGPIGFSSVAGDSLGTISAALSTARKDELALYDKYGDFAQIKEAIQAGVMWNWIYTPAEGPMAPVSRGWTFTPYPITSDFEYVVFDWDNAFASLILGHDAAAKDLAYSNLIQLVRSKTNNGFVPNYSAGGSKSSDRTEPCVSAKVLHLLHQKYKDDWMIELLFDDLMDEHNWFYEYRRLAPLQLISLGSSFIPILHSVDDTADSMVGARLESGLDNSPMYDGEFFDVAGGQMQLYDIGMTSMFIMEADILAELGDIIGRKAESALLRTRAAAMRDLLSQNLWNDQLGIFVNKFANGTFYTRISPTSFYPLFARAATDEQADRMMRGWMMNNTHFCITPNGDFEGNTKDCYWGLPSIEASDPAFPPLGYWRGFIWGPMVQLVYWGLQQYDHVPSVRQARKALVKQMSAMMLNQWQRNHHICENFSPHRDDAECTGNHFYHWGALAGLVSLFENNLY